MWHPARNDDGFVLVAALWVLILLSIIAASAIATSRTDHFIARSAITEARARALAEAGVTRAVIALMVRDQNEPWPIDGSPRDFAYADAQIEIATQDEFGKVDLNAASDEVLRIVLAAAGAERDAVNSMVDAIADWHDGDDDRRLHGAEKSDYLAAGLAYIPRNAPFENVAELEQVLGVPRAVAQRAAPMLTVYSRRAMVDPTVAPQEVWKLLPEIAAGIPGGVSGAQSRSGRTRSGVDGTTSSLVDLTGRAFTITATARTANNVAATRRAVVRFTGDSRRPYWVHEWR